MKKFLLSILLCSTLASLTVPSQKVSALSSQAFTFVILSRYHLNTNIGEENDLIAFSSNGKPVTWKSSNSKIASVNTYGKVTAKKAGKVTITAKIKYAEASCIITVNKTKIVMRTQKAFLERGETITLSASTSNHTAIHWKSNKKSIATVDENGFVTTLKPGKATITANADGSSASCLITVKSPTLRISKTSHTLFRGETIKLSATVSSTIKPTWKSNKKSVCVVDENGNVTAIKNGIATITVTVDGVSKTCELQVLKPDITLSSSEISLKLGEHATIIATVSSGNSPIWSSSNTCIVSISSKGEITAKEKGSAYIYATEDGIKSRCKVRVTE